MNIFQNLHQTYKSGNATIRLIYINAGVFLLLQAIDIICRLFNISDLSFFAYLSLPASLPMWLNQPWTIITYMFVHKDFFHILFNMLTLFWFGKIFLMSFSEKQLVGLYWTGGIVSGIVYALAFNLFPYFKPSLEGSLLLGASGSIMSVIVATALRMPNLEMRMLLIGSIKMKYIAIAVVLISFFGITGNNAGGEIAHLGGALFGYIFVVSLQNGKDLTAWINFILDKLHDLFKPRRLKTTRKKSTNQRKMTDAEFNMNKARSMEDIDRILDKIKKSGYESLSAEEKRKLFDQKK